jgi:putative alpha-1,2-mannosidase
VAKSGEFAPGSFEATAQKTRSAWAEKLDRVRIEGATPEQLEIYYTAMVHGLTYPYETHEYGRYYSACDNQVHDGVSHNGYSNWVKYIYILSSGKCF